VNKSQPIWFSCGLLCSTVRLNQGCSAEKKGVGTHQKIAILKQLPTHFKAKREKGVGTPFPRVPPHYTPDVNIGSHRKSYFKKKSLRKVLLSF